MLAIEPLVERFEAYGHAAYSACGDSMQYHHVCLESLGYSLPDEIVTTDEIEQRLAPLYERLRLPEGRLELMSGIRERRFWPRGTLPSEQSIESGGKAIEAAGIDRARSVPDSRLGLPRPSGAGHRLPRASSILDLPRECLIYDVSNACLGLLNGIVQVANMIELGQIRAGLVVGTEGSRQLVETTIDELNRDVSLTRDDVKPAVASLTIGSASAPCCWCIASSAARAIAGRRRGAGPHGASRAVPQRRR